MQLTLLSPRKSLNKAYLKVKPSRSAIELFKVNLIKLLDGLDESESEEHVKNDLSDFLKNTFFQKFYINTKGRNDLVIHNGPDAKSFAGVLIEAKKPSNKFEMIRQDNLNAKAFHELILYYLRERITNHNLEIKHLVATNIYEWYIFDAGLFEKMFAQNKTLVKQFTDFEEGRLSGNTTDFFYKQIAEPFMAGLTSEFCFTMFDFREYDKPLRNDDKKDDSKLIALYKLLSPEHLLKLPFTNDSNSLDKSFYTELLHIIGLTETKEGSKKLIGRKKEGQRDPGSLIENAIIQIDSLDIISRIDKPSRFGETLQERLFNVSLELAITWINRILFMKLLEAQLFNYHNSDPSYVFLTNEKIKGYDSLNSLFFRVLARKNTERDPAVTKLFEKVPYLNSSLFEPTELERDTIFISNLQDDCLIPIHQGTVLKNNTGKRLSGNMNGLDYLFAFLDAYDFSGEGAEEIQEDNKTLINASVLGLIFEKINGYKDGSFFTPGFITMYMCHETIRRAAVQKFNDAKGWDCKDIDQVYDKIEDRSEANTIINSLKICDPAVGSGHFLVSALNEIIALKSDLNILQDREGRRLKEYRVEVVNDELIVTDEDGELFVYNPKNKESQRIQQTLFHEKQTIIENCLFGVDINPNSVKICRLRLWIELLKNSYYKAESNFTELETLPNIDINIKCGNSLISRYALDADIKQALKKSKWSIDSYRVAVMSYRNATNKEEKRTMERLIESIKTDFETEVAANDKRLVQLRKLNADLFNLTQQTSLFDLAKKEKDEWNKKVKDLTSKIQKLETELGEIKSNKIFENALEWRFEFPEVLNDDGDFVGFDVVIGNPPYGVKFCPSEKNHFAEQYQTMDDIYTIFIERGLNVLKFTGSLSYIIPIFWLTGENYFSTRKLILDQAHLERGIILPYDIFADAYVDTGLFMFSREVRSSSSLVYEFNPKDKLDHNILNSISFMKLAPAEWNNSLGLKIIFNQVSRSLVSKLGRFDNKISDISNSIRGILADQLDYSEIPLDEDYKPIFIGKLDRYYLDNEFQYVKYGENLKEKPSSCDFFEDERLLVRRIVNRRFRIMATIATNSFVNKKDIYVFKPTSTDFSCKYLLAIINSKLISFIKTKGSVTAKKDDFTQLTLNDIRQLGIPKPNQYQLFLIEGFVDTILNVKKSDPYADTTAQEMDIDRIIYELYDLTEEEIKIIEEDTI
jgi:adenine-specific DNA-methyltransferase